MIVRGAYILGAISTQQFEASDAGALCVRETVRSNARDGKLIGGKASENAHV